MSLPYSAMEKQDHHKELQLLPTRFSHKQTRGSSSYRSWAGPSGSSDPSLDLQLSISLQPFREKKIDAGCIEAVQWQAAEQFRLASIEKAYAEQVREMTRREMELAHSEFARARQIWESAQREVEKVERLKARAIRQTDSACMEITCQACRRKFRA